MEKQIELNNAEHSTKRNLDALVIEIEEELMGVICNLIWFAITDNINETESILYNPRVGQGDAICFHYIFNRSKKFAR